MMCIPVDPCLSPPEKRAEHVFRVMNRGNYHLLDITAKEAKRVTIYMPTINETISLEGASEQFNSFELLSMLALAKVV